MAEIQRANPQARRVALAFVAVAALFGAGTLALFDSNRQSLLSWFVARPSHVQLGIVVVVWLLLTAPLLLMAAWMWGFGIRVLRGNRHPPDGIKLIRDTPVTYGAGARVFGRLYQVLAALSVVAALSMLWAFWTVLRLQS